MPAIHAATFGNDLARITMLVNEDPEAVNSMTGTERLYVAPLHIAITIGSLEAASCLLHHGANINQNAITRRGIMTPLHQACLNQFPDMVELLMERGADPTICFTDGTTPLLTAVQMKSVECVRSLLKYDLARTVVEWHSHDCEDTPLEQACLHGQAEIVKLLLDAGADPTVRSSRDMTPLIVATYRGSVDVAKHLLNDDRGRSTIDDISSNGSTALAIACYLDKPEIIKLLLDAGADPLLTGSYGQKPVDIAVLRGHHDCAKLLKVTRWL